MPEIEYEVIIRLEIHVLLKTGSKIFSAEEMSVVLGEVRQEGIACRPKVVPILIWKIRT